MTTNSFGFATCCSIDRLKLFVRAVSLGDPETLITRPAQSRHRGSSEPDGRLASALQPAKSRASLMSWFSSSKYCGRCLQVATSLLFLGWLPASLLAATASPSLEGRGLNRTIPDLELSLLWVPPGTFTMGSSREEPERNKAEGPETRVTFPQGFWLGKTEVTQAQYESVMGRNPSVFKDVGPTAPVENVSWLDAMSFCRKLNERETTAGRLPEGYTYSLPTEAQWEYAYRAGTTGAYPGEVAVMSWNVGNSNGSTHVVAGLKPNPWGFYDMPGNVLEWCYDWYGDYPGGAVTDPDGPSRGYYRMARGGSWRIDVRSGRSAARSGGSEGRMDYTIGFRLALTPIRQSNL